MELPLEHEVEEAFVEELKTFRHMYKNYPFVYWYERQVTMPYQGRADIVTTGPMVTTVTEVKRGKVRGKALAQLMGYMGQLADVIGRKARVDYSLGIPASRCIRGYLVGNDYSEMVFRAVQAHDRLELVTYDVNDQGEIEFATVEDAICLPRRSEQRKGRFLHAIIENAIDHLIDIKKEMDTIYGELPY